MSDTQIDSLQIKIVASANDAAAAISNVASAVGKLSDKKTQNAKNFLSTLSAELEKIKTASTAVANISALAQSLGALAGVGSLVKATNGLKNIAPAVNALQAADLTGVSEKMTALANAMVPLSGMTGLSGFSRAMSSLKGLPDINKKLTPETLDSFTEKVKRVADAVTPLSDKLTTVAQGFQAMNVPVREATQNTENFNKAISTINFSAILSVAKNIFAFFQKATKEVLKVTQEVIDLDGIIERFNRGFGDSAEEAYSWIKRLNEEMGLNVQMFMQYTSIFAQMLEGLGVAQKDASKMAIGYSELAYDIWAAYNDIYEKYEDAVKAVQSAIAGQTRPLRRAGFSVLNVTLEQTAANHGLEISIQKATEAEKSYLRYLSLVDQAQAQGIVGTYAKEMNTAEGQLRTFRQQMKSLTQEAGSFLLPLLTKTVPIVQAAVKLISEAIQKLAALFGVTLRTPEWSNSTGFTEAVEGAEDAAEGIESAMGGAAGSAKELKKTLLGIDEINQLNGANKSSGGGGGGGGSSVNDALAGYDWDVSSLWTEAIFKDINSQVDQLAEKIRGMIPEISALGSALLGVFAAAKNPIIAIGIDFFVNGISAYNAVNADNLGDSIMYILGGMLATAGAGISLSRKFGATTGWAIALGVAVVAQITGMSFALAKGAEFGAGAIAQSIVTTLEGAGAGALLGLKIGGPAGAAVGAVIGAGLTIAIEAIAFTSAMNKAEFERRLAEDIHNRWGDNIGYTAKELRVMATNIMFEGNYDEQSVKLKTKIMVERESMQESLADAFAQLSSDMFKLNVGIDVDENKIQQDVDNYIKAVRDYIDTSHADKQLSFELLGISDSSLAQWENDQYMSNMEDLERYYSLLREVTINGTLTYDNITFEVENRQAAVNELNRMIQELLDEAAQTKFEARMSVLEFKYSGNMGKEDFEGLFAEAGAAYEEFASAMYDSMESAYSSAIDRRKESIKNGSATEAEAWAQYYEDIMLVNEQYSGKLGTALLNTVDYAMGVLKEKYAEVFNDPEIDAAFEHIQHKINYGLSIHPEDVIPSIDEYASGMSEKIKFLHPEIAAELQSIFDAMKPTQQQLQDLANWYTAAGIAVPESISNGINDLNKIGEMAGDISALEYKLGHDMIYQPEFYSMLLNTENAFSKITDSARDGIANNMSIVYDAAGNLVLQTSDGIQHQVDLTSPIVRANLERLGLVIPEGVASGTESGMDAIVGPNGAMMLLKNQTLVSLADKFKPEYFSPYGKTILNGFKSGATPASNEFTNMAQLYQQYMRSNLSKYMSWEEFVRYGLAVPEGVKIGMDKGNDLSSHASWILRNINPKTDEVINGMKNIGGNLVKGIIEGMDKESKSQTTSNGIKNVGNKILSLTKYHTEIGSPSKLFADQVGYWLTQGIVVGMDQPDALIDPLETMYTNAKDWWDDNTMDIVGGDFEFTDESGKNHYMDIKDANNEQNSLLREQNALLRAILEKESSGGYYGTSGEAMLEAASHLNRRTGKTMIPVGV